MATYSIVKVQLWRKLDRRIYSVIDYERLTLESPLSSDIGDDKLTVVGNARRSVARQRQMRRELFQQESPNLRRTSYSYTGYDVTRYFRSVGSIYDKNDIGSNFSKTV